MVGWRVGLPIGQYLHLSSVNCFRTSPTICPTLCRAFKSFSDLSNCFVRSFSFSRSEMGHRRGHYETMRTNLRKMICNFLNNITSLTLFEFCLDFLVAAQLGPVLLQCLLAQRVHRDRPGSHFRRLAPKFRRNLINKTFFRLTTN